MAVWQNERNKRKSREEYFAILENDPEHRYEYLDGDIYMMTGGSPDHEIEDHGTLSATLAWL